MKQATTDVSGNSEMQEKVSDQSPELRARAEAAEVRNTAIHGFHELAGLAMAADALLREEDKASASEELSYLSFVLNSLFGRAKALTVEIEEAGRS